MLGRTRAGQILVQDDNVIGYNNNPGAGYLITYEPIRHQRHDQRVDFPNQPDSGAGVVSGMNPNLYRENMVVLMIMQAIASVLTSNVQGLSVEFTGPHDVVTHFLLRDSSPSDEHEIFENLPAEVSVLTNGLEGVGETVVRPVVVVARDHPGGYRLPGRLVFLFRD